MFGVPDLTEFGNRLEATEQAMKDILAQLKVTNQLLAIMASQNGLKTPQEYIDLAKARAEGG